MDTVEKLPSPAEQAENHRTRQDVIRRLETEQQRIAAELQMHYDTEATICAYEILLKRDATVIDDLRESLAKNQDELEEAQADLEETQAQLEEAQADLGETQAQLEEAQAELEDKCTRAEPVETQASDEESEEEEVEA